MRYALLASIRVYWLLWPVRWKRRCLFRETCSHHVFHVTSSLGFGQGLRALHTRYRQCRPGYSVLVSGDGVQMQLIDGTMIRGKDANPDLLTSIAGAGPEWDTCRGLALAGASDAEV